MISPSRQLDFADTHSIVPHLANYSIGDVMHYVGTEQNTIQLSPDDTNLELFFTTFDIVNRDNIRFACKIEGWDKDWKLLPEGVNSIQYINLQHGSYRVLVRATDAYGRWSRAVCVLTIDRLPAWWETWWFKTIAWIAVIAVVVYAIFFYVMRRFRQRIFLHSDEIQQTQLMDVNDEDEKMLKKALEIVEAHLTESEFSVEDFSREMCMSRMSLYRKLQTLTGQSPSEYIRTIRLKRAAKIIREENCPLSEVADRTGFSTPAYFSKCFKDMYGVSPSAFKQNTPQ